MPEVESNKLIAGNTYCPALKQLMSNQKVDSAIIWELAQEIGTKAFIKGEIDNE